MNPNHFDVFKIENHVTQDNDTKLYYFEVWVLTPGKPPLVYDSDNSYATRDEAIMAGTEGMKDMAADLYKTFGLKFTPDQILDLGDSDKPTPTGGKGDG